MSCHEACGQRSFECEPRRAAAGRIPRTYNIRETVKLAYYIVKLIITAFLIVVISELSKRSSFIGALLASAPVVSVLAMVWLYVDTRDPSKVTALSNSIFWLVLPSLALFITLPLLLKGGVNFYLSLCIGIGITVLCYWLMVAMLGHYGVKL
jgi:hypothetical protein